MLALEGIRILDLSGGYPPAFGTQILGDLGADVINIEGRRGMRDRHAGITDERGRRRAAYQAINRNKKSIVLNLKSEEARRILKRLEFHHTPKHGSWLNIAEIELSVLIRQCLDRRIGDKETLINEVEAWNTEPNLNAKVVDWQFTTSDARIKLARLYPSFHD